MMKLKLHEYADITHQAEFELLEDLEIGELKLQKGFLTDGATIPRLFVFAALFFLLFGALGEGILAGFLFWLGWAFIALSYLVPPFGRYALATFAHDYLLKVTTRKEADRELKGLLKKMEIHPFLIAIIYRGVRIQSSIKGLVRWK